VNEENDIKEHNLIVRQLTSEITADEEKRLQEWIALSEKNRKVYDAIKKALELTGKHYTPTDYRDINVNVDEEWSHFLESVKRGKKTVRFTPESSGKNLWMRIAAVLLLVVVSGLVVNYFITQPTLQVHRTADTMELITLPDGSSVSLNRNSELSYDKSFGKEKREVSLIGEGFFEVVADASTPFVVTTGGAIVTVVGTSFNVRGYSDSDELEVVVETGVVRLEPQALDQNIELQAGEIGLFKKSGKVLTSNKNENANYAAWKTRRIVLDGSSLPAIVEVLRSVYGADIIISASVANTCQATVTFENQTLEAVLSVLKTTLDLTYKFAGDKIEIVQAGC